MRIRLEAQPVLHNVHGEARQGHDRLHEARGKVPADGERHVVKAKSAPQRRIPHEQRHAQHPQRPGHRRTQREYPRMTQRPRHHRTREHSLDLRIAREAIEHHDAERA